MDQNEIDRLDVLFKNCVGFQPGGFPTADIDFRRELVNAWPEIRDYISRRADARRKELEDAAQECDRYGSSYFAGKVRALIDQPDQPKEPT